VIPVVKLAFFKNYGHGSYWLRSRVAVGDTRPACQLLTLQVWDSLTKPADLDHLTETPRMPLRISKYASLVKFNYGNTFTPRWVRVENKVGTWSSWYPIPTGTH
jgi:hypothetical protein